MSRIRKPLTLCKFMSVELIRITGQSKRPCAGCGDACKKYVGSLWLKAGLGSGRHAKDVLVCPSCGYGLLGKLRMQFKLLRAVLYGEATADTDCRVPPLFKPLFAREDARRAKVRNKRKKKENADAE